MEMNGTYTVPLGGFGKVVTGGSEGSEVTCWTFRGRPRPLLVLGRTSELITARGELLVLLLSRLPLDATLPLLLGTA